MQTRTYAAAALLVASGAIASSQALASPNPVADRQSPAHESTALAPTHEGHGSRRSFDRFLERYEAANSAFLNGDPTLWMSIVSDREPVSIFGGFGGLGEVGLEQVNDRYLLAATAFLPSGAHVDIEYLVKDVQGRLAYTVAIERSEVLFANQTETLPQVLRVTMMFRRERGEWKIVHRHADNMIELQLPTP